MKTLKYFVVAVAAVLAMGAISWGQSFLTNGLIAYYPFNGNANDASGNGNNGTIYGGVTLVADRFGRPNSAYLFNGVDGYIDIKKPLGDNPSALTESAWVNISTRETSAAGVSPHDVIITQRESSGASWPSLSISASGGSTGMSEIIVDCSSYINKITGTTYHETNTWVFLCGTLLNNVYSIYVNGVLENSMYDDHSPNSADDMFLMHQGTWGTFCNGMLNNVRIYNRALTAQEVSQLYTFESTPAIAIAQDLTNTYAVYGHSASFSISSTGLSALSYQWYFVPSNGGGQAGAYAQTIVGFVYGAVVTNGGFGYGNVPSVNFVGGGGVGASGYADLA